MEEPLPNFTFIIHIRLNFGPLSFNGNKRIDAINPLVRLMMTWHSFCLCGIIQCHFHARTVNKKE